MTTETVPTTERKRRFYRLAGSETYHRDRACSYLTHARTADPAALVAFHAVEPGPGGAIPFVLASYAGVYTPCPRCGV